ncbi:peptide-N(4)-(N-acetyl-beta-glucosaminyl)asparagine amidase isoform X1 [Lampetra fluviatilis]
MARRSGVSDGLSDGASDGASGGASHGVSHGVSDGVSDGVRELSEGSEESKFQDAAGILLAYADNVLRNPEERRFRSIRLANPAFSSRLLPVPGAVQCLFEMGFAEDETQLVLPADASLDTLRKVRDQIESERNRRLGRLPLQPSAQPPSQPLAQSHAAAVTDTTAAGGPQRHVSPEMRDSERQMLETLRSSFSHVLLYELADVQAQARACIPVEELHKRALEKLQAVEDTPQTESQEGALRDLLLLELQAWFKTWFSWVDSLPCERCHGPTTARGQGLPPTADDLQGAAGRVEAHWCGSCQHATRFPRYNHPARLLVTRRGRCGEWANCFTLCCRALGFEARYVLDLTDHVWTEVYSESQARWLHCDPGEGFDKPLLYELGWGKKLNYVFAFSKDELVDVSWRYSCRHTDMLSRRTRCREGWLRSTIARLNHTRQQAIDVARRTQLLQRCVVELVEFLSPREPQEGAVKYGGRQTGSVAWRTARGELGLSRQPRAHGAVFSPTESERASRRLHIRYSTARDAYVRACDAGSELAGWESAVHAASSLQRKVETDWNMVYLARTEGSNGARVSWRFDLAGSGMEAGEVSVAVSSTTFHGAIVTWEIGTEGAAWITLQGDGVAHGVEALRSATAFTLRAELAGGAGDEAWQHSQLFRQPLAAHDEFPLDVIVHLILTDGDDKTRCDAHAPDVRGDSHGQVTDADERDEHDKKDTDGEHKD